MLTCSISAKGLCSESDCVYPMQDGDVSILISPGEGGNPDDPRTSGSAQIRAYYDSDLSCVCAYLSNAGTSVSVVIVVISN